MFYRFTFEIHRAAGPQPNGAAAPVRISKKIFLKKEGFIVEEYKDSYLLRRIGPHDDVLKKP